MRPLSQHLDEKIKLHLAVSAIMTLGQCCTRNIIQSESITASPVESH